MKKRRHGQVRTRERLIQERGPGAYLLDLAKNAEAGDVLLLCELHGDVRRQLACATGSGKGKKIKRIKI